MWIKPVFKEIGKVCAIVTSCYNLLLLFTQGTCFVILKQIFKYVTYVHVAVVTDALFGTIFIVTITAIHNLEYEWIRCHVVLELQLYCTFPILSTVYSLSFGEDECRETYYLREKM